MPIRIPTLRAAGLSAEQIVRVLEIEENERLLNEREGARQRKRRERERRTLQEKITNEFNHRVTVVTRDQCDTSPLPLPLKETSPTPPKENNPLPPSPTSSLRSDSCGGDFAHRTCVDLFEEFWREYPKRDGSNPKHTAKQKFIAILRSGTSFADVMAGLRRDRKQLESKNQVGTVFVPQAQTWLNQKRWDVGEQGSLPLLSVVSSGPSAYDLELIEEYRRKNGGVNG